MLEEFLTAVSKNEKQASDYADMVSTLKHLPTPELLAIAMGESKLAYSDDEDEWLKKYEGTEFHEQALALAQECLELDIAEGKQRLEREMQPKPEEQDFWKAKDVVRLKKRILDLELNKKLLAAAGGGQPQAPAAPAAPAGLSADPMGDVKAAATKASPLRALLDSDEVGEAADPAALSQLLAGGQQTWAQHAQHLQDHPIKGRLPAAALGAAAGAGLGAGAGKVLSGSKPAVLGGSAIGALVGALGLGAVPSVARSQGYAGEYAGMNALSPEVKQEALRSRQLESSGGKHAADLGAVAKSGLKRGKELLTGSRIGELKKQYGNVHIPYKGTAGTGSQGPLARSLAGELAGEKKKVLGARIAAGAAGGAAVGRLTAGKKEAEIEKKAFGALAPAMLQGAKGVLGGAKALGQAGVQGARVGGLAGAGKAMGTLGRNQVQQAGQWAVKNPGAAAGLAGAGLAGAGALGYAAG